MGLPFPGAPPRKRTGRRPKLKDTLIQDALIEADWIGASLNPLNYFEFFMEPNKMSEADRLLARRVAECLLDVQAVRFAPDKPFTLASGLLAPVYCDNRLLLSSPAARRAVCDGFVRVWRMCGLTADIVTGAATAGIPHAAWLADRLDLPMAYARAQSKKHGRGQRIEGGSVAGRSTVVVEDLVSTGGSSCAVVEALREAGADVQAALAIFSQGFASARIAFEKAQTPLYALTGLDALLEAARERDALSDTAIRTILDWRADPEGWSIRHTKA